MSSNNGANQAAAEIVNTVMRKLVEDAVEGKKVYDLVIEGDQAIEAAAATVFNKKTKAGAIPKGMCRVFSLLRRPIDQFYR